MAPPDPGYALRPHPEELPVTTLALTTPALMTPALTTGALTPAPARDATPGGLIGTARAGV
jgi:hypothetical protein